MVGGWGADLGKVQYIIIIPLSNGGAASPGEFVLNGRFARRTGQREKRLPVGRKSCLHLHNHINTHSFFFFVSFFWVPFQKKKNAKRQTREGFRLPLVEVCCCRLYFFSACSYFLKSAASVGKVASFFLNLLPAPLFNISVFSPCNVLFERGLVRPFWPLSLVQGGKK